MSCYPDRINKVLLIGLGGVGTVYANLINNSGVDFRVLVDCERLKKYTTAPRYLNNKICEFKYILPTDRFQPDLIIISTKSNGLKDAIEQIKPFVNEKTLIMSFINGISSEETLGKYFKDEQIIHSYIICHTITRNGHNVEHDGVTKVVWGDKTNNIDKIKLIRTFFDETNITNEFTEDIIKALWEKFCFNCCVNQISAITGYTFEQMWSNQECLSQMENISKEINILANACGIRDINLVETTFKNLHKMIPTGKTSMLQDIENCRKAEIDLFGEEVLRLAKKFNINVPFNKKLYESLNTKITNS